KQTAMPERATGRRSMLRRLGLGVATGFGIIGGRKNVYGEVVKDNEKEDAFFSSYDPKPMKIVKVESVRFSENINVGGGSGGSGRAEFCWVQLHTDTGIIGLGETYPGINGELGALKDLSKRFLIGKDARDVDGIWQNIYQYMSMRNAGGSDMRILSAINMAQLDALGKSMGLPLYRLLGGKTRPRVKVYNTTTDYWAIDNMKMGQDTDKIVKFLLDKGITAMKIYPFNEFSFMEGGRNGSGQFLTSEDLEKGLTWLKQIRDTAGNKMEILIDAGGRWNLTSSQRILKAIEPYNVIHFEDIQIPSNAQQAYAILARETSVPIAHSETIATRYEVKDFLEAKAMDILMFDLCWCGGPGEAKKMADLADAYNIPTSPHTAGGPLLWLSSIHLCTAMPNFCYMESNYWKYTHQYPYFMNNVPVPVNGYVSPPETPGLGAEIKPELFSSGDAIVETIAEL
ncbi:MAG TPA: mandelate racemase/muconate lactonizing enzyme family protein, partial [Chryseosolibacter sp.]|nr:mandelate racemase/muconate lactonizing enzyme family protein [Chryseosolibacter sp.]